MLRIRTVYLYVQYSNMYTHWSRDADHAPLSHINSLLFPLLMHASTALFVQLPVDQLYVLFRFLVDAYIYTIKMC